MKILFEKTLLLFIVIVTISSCGKSYVCHCVDDLSKGPSDSTALGEVRAYSKKKAEKICEQRNCNGYMIVE